MCKVFYKDKDIIFARNNGGRPENIAIFADSPSIEEVVRALAENGGVRVVADDPGRAFREFVAQFRRVEAAGGVVADPRGRTLMILRNGVWDLPKGKREEGEETAGCALREVEEECGVSGLRVRGLRCVTYHIYDTYGEWTVKPTSWYDMACDGGCPLTPQREEGIEAAEWVPSDEMPEKLKNTYATIRDVLLKSKK